MSDAWCELMARLGYRRFGAQGSWSWTDSGGDLHRAITRDEISGSAGRR
ncbi:hypothetical protein ACWEF6_20245 [Amycolatopsis sp. NPDC004772]